MKVINEYDLYPSCYVMLLQYIKFKSLTLFKECFAVVKLILSFNSMRFLYHENILPFYLKTKYLVVP